MSRTIARVLYVEDEADDVFFMRNAFRRLGIEAAFHSVEDGDRAILYLAGKPPYGNRENHPPPQMVLLDLNLPVRSGFEVLEWLRGRPEFQSTPVVVFSSSGRPEDRALAERLGASDYLLKPASGAHFLTVARDVVERWLGAPGAGDERRPD